VVKTFLSLRFIFQEEVIVGDRWVKPPCHPSLLIRVESLSICKK